MYRRTFIGMAGSLGFGLSSAALSAAGRSIGQAAEKGTGDLSGRGWMPDASSNSTLYPRAITDNRLVPYPATPPDPGQAGTVIIDPFCGNSMLRVTDAYSNPDAPGRTYTTPDSSEAQPWAADGSLFIVNDTNGFEWLYSFDPSTLVSVRRRSLPFDAAQFSYRQPPLIWGNKGFLIQRLDLRTGEVKTLWDVARSIHIPSEPRWYLNAISNDWFDARLSFNLGPRQDENTLVVVWDSLLGLCWLDTSTGQYDGWAKGGIEPWTPFTIHNTKLSKGGDLVKINPAGGHQMAFWTPGTSQFALVATNQDLSPFDGHQALGFHNYYGCVHKQVWCQWIKMPFWDWVDGWTNLQNPVPEPAPGIPWGDYHISVQPDGSDRKPLLISTFDGNNPDEPGAPLVSSVPGINEILAMSTDGSGRFWRLAHTYASGRQGFYSTPRGNVCPNGQFFLFTSDWEQTLGEGRSDVFCLKMR